MNNLNSEIGVSSSSVFSSLERIAYSGDVDALNQEFLVYEFHNSTHNSSLKDSLYRGVDWRDLGNICSFFYRLNDIEIKSDFSARDILGVVEELDNIEFDASYSRAYNDVFNARKTLMHKLKFDFQSFIISNSFKELSSVFDSGDFKKYFSLKRDFEKVISTLNNYGLDYHNIITKLNVLEVNNGLVDCVDDLSVNVYEPLQRVLNFFEEGSYKAGFVVFDEVESYLKNRRSSELGSFYDYKNNLVNSFLHTHLEKSFFNAEQAKEKAMDFHLRNAKILLDYVKRSDFDLFIIRKVCYKEKIFDVFKGFEEELSSVHPNTSRLSVLNADFDKYKDCLVDVTFNLNDTSFVVDVENRFSFFKDSLYSKFPNVKID